MILTGHEILAQMSLGRIMISDFNHHRLGPNSYNLRLADRLLVYDEVVLDMKVKPRTKILEIPPEGLELKPGELYLGSTMEYTTTHRFVPMIEGRSSIGRLGLFVHITAGFGDVGFKGNWTLEISCIRPIRIYAGIEICQIFYHTVQGEIHSEYHGKYQGDVGISASRLHQEF